MALEIATDRFNPILPTMPEAGISRNIEAMPTSPVESMISVSPAFSMAR